MNITTMDTSSRINEFIGPRSPGKYLVYSLSCVGGATILWIVATATGIISKILIVGAVALGAYSAYRLIKEMNSKSAE